MVEIGKFEIIVGFLCNENCRFCSIAYNMHHKKTIMPLNEIKKNIDYAKKLNAPVISFTGGEPTIVPHLVDAIKYANEKEFEEIEIQTNGRMFSYDKFVKKIVEAGANRFLVSIHSHKSEISDMLTRVPGSWAQTFQGIRNLKKFLDKGEIKELRTNTVINKINYRKLPTTMEFLYNMDLTAYHLSPTIVDGNALDNIDEIVPKFSEISFFVKKAIDLAKSRNKTVFLYSLLPCIIPGYQNYIVDMISEKSTDTILSGRGFKASIWKHKFKHRVKQDSCKKCKFYNMCPGPWKRYVTFFGFDEFKPIKK